MSLENGVLVDDNESVRGKGRAEGGCGWWCGCGMTLRPETDVVGLCLACLPLVRVLLFGAFGFAGGWDFAGADGFGDNEFAGMGRSMTRRWRRKRAIGMLITTGSTANGRNWEL